MVAAIAAALGVFAACGGDESTEAALTRAQLAEGCYIDSDCQAPSRCAFRKCHTECESSRDCDEKGATGARCVPAQPRPFKVCQLPDEKNCALNSDCPEGLRCAADRQCRSECQSDRDCAHEQVCTTSVCADPKELVQGSLPTPTEGSLPQTGEKCTYNSDCTVPGGPVLLCRNGRCSVECKANIDCENVNKPLCDKGECKPVPGSCVPKGCKDVGATCGQILDGCGGIVSCEPKDGTSACGNSTPYCGGSGKPNECGASVCVPKTCNQLGFNCGMVSDGCGGVLNCGACIAPATCGAKESNRCGCVADGKACVGKQCGQSVDNCGNPVDCGSCAAGQDCGANSTPYQCGCVKKTCNELGFNCGTAPDGCGGTLDCGQCGGGQVCGGGTPGTPNVCGNGACQAIPSCASVGKNCGNISNNCGGTLQCGACQAPESCGGGGVTNVCGCVKKTCGALNLNCGSASDGCGGTLQCGSCVAPATCGGTGTPGQCGCQKTTCAAQGKNCGIIADGCGGTLECGSCQNNQICGANGNANTCSDPGPVKSCVGLASTCGPTNNDSCCRSETVVGLAPNDPPFFRRYETTSPPGATAPIPQYPTRVSSFKLDVYEVTIGRLRAWINANNSTAFRGTPPAAGAGAHSVVSSTIPANYDVGTGWQSAWNTNLPVDKADWNQRLQSCGNNLWTAAPTGVEDRPVPCVTWYEAFAFCAWDGGRLPIETEYQYAYNGGNEYRRYPWGATAPTCSHDTVNSDYYMQQGQCTWPVRAGSAGLGVGKWGQYNLAGSLGEWLFDAASPQETPDCSGAMCAYQNPYSYGMVGGSSFSANWYYYNNNDPWPDKYGMGYTNYYYYSPYYAWNGGQPREQRYANTGFRCARNL